MHANDQLCGVSYHHLCVLLCYVLVCRIKTGDDSAGVEPLKLSQVLSTMKCKRCIILYNAVFHSILDYALMFVWNVKENGCRIHHIYSFIPDMFYHCHQLYQIVLKVQYFVICTDARHRIIFNKLNIFRKTCSKTRWDDSNKTKSHTTSKNTSSTHLPTLTPQQACKHYNTNIIWHDLAHWSVQRL